MNQQSSEPYIWITFFTFMSLLYVLLTYHLFKKSVGSIVEALLIQDRDYFIQAVKLYLDSKLSRDPVYTASSPRDVMELHAYFLKWRSRFDKSPWIVVPFALFIQIIVGTRVLWFGGSEPSGATWAFLLGSTLLVLLLALLSGWRTSRRFNTLRGIDSRLDQYAAPERKRLADAEGEEKASRLSRLNAISSIPKLITTDDAEALSRPAPRISERARKNLIYLAGPGLLLLVLVIGLILYSAFGWDESAMTAIVFLGVVGMLTIILIEVVIWTSRRAERKRPPEQPDVKQLQREIGIPLPCEPPFPELPTYEAETICERCGMLVSLDAGTCPHCGSLRRGMPGTSRRAAKTDKWV